MTAPTAGHVLRIEADRFGIELSVECREPDGAPCRLDCAEPAERCGREDMPPHSDYEGEHATRDMGDCNYRLWLTEDPSLLPELHDPAAGPEPISDGMPVDIRWDGDSYVWRAAKVEPAERAA